MKVIFKLYILSLFCLFQSCAGTAQEERDQVSVPRLISVDRAEGLLEGDGFVLLDVRTKGEFDEGYIEGAGNIDFMSWDSFTQETEKLEKSVPVIVYCRSGGRSAKAATYLADNGFHTVYDIDGGILEWKKNGKPLIQD